MHKGFDTLVVLVWWLIWRERNTRVFDDRHVAVQPAQLVQRIRDEGSLWVAADTFLSVTCYLDAGVRRSLAVGPADALCLLFAALIALFSIFFSFIISLL
jgi:hypothetical protein